MQNDNSPNLPPVPNMHRESLSPKKTILILSAIIFVVSVMGFVLRSSFFKDTKTDSQSTIQSMSLEAFSPTPVRIGEFSVLSACRALSREDVVNAFGSDFLQVPNITSEQFQYVSLPNSRITTGKNATTTSCEYISLQHQKETVWPFFGVV